MSSARRESRYTAPMNDMPVPGRKRLRAEGYDYSQPAGYLVTICTHHRLPLFGNITEHDATLSPAGRMVEEHWQTIPARYPFVELDAFVVMPNHLHGILIIQPCDGQIPPSSHSDIIATFKSRTTYAYARGVRHDGWPPFPAHLWQRSFHDRIIRSDRHLDRLQEYVESNPDRWPWDEENPDHIPASRITRYAPRLIH